MPEPNKLYISTKNDGQMITAGKFFVKAQYLCSMQVDTDWYCYPHNQQRVSTVPTRTIIHPKLEVNAINDFHYIPKSVCNRTHAK